MNTAVIGALWGDEGKGKVVDYLAKDADAVVRFNGGNNAGHTVQIGDERRAVHGLPVGIMRPNVTNVIAAGCVVDPLVLRDEIVEAEACLGRRVKLMVSERAHVILPHHIRQDILTEKIDDPSHVPLGTTRRGNGPVHSDKYLRFGMRMAEATRLAVDVDRLAARLEMRLDSMGDFNAAQRALCRSYAEALRDLRDYVGDTTTWLHDANARGLRILFEGAHGTLLDIDHGSYPYVTSSHCTAAGVAAGTGLMTPMKVVGVLKAYATRVGAGPFPTIMADATQRLVREAGREYGTTTGRPRHVGWLDLVAARYSEALNAFDHLAITSLDVLGCLNEPIKVCVGYRRNGRAVALPPAIASEWAACEPVYEEWETPRGDFSDAREWGDLPLAAQALVARIESAMGVRVGLISTGPGRDQMIDLRAGWN